MVSHSSNTAGIIVPYPWSLPVSHYITFLPHKKDLAW